MKKLTVEEKLTTKELDRYLKIVEDYIGSPIIKSKEYLKGRKDLTEKEKEIAHHFLLGQQNYKIKMIREYRRDKFYECQRIIMENVKQDAEKEVERFKQIREKGNQKIRNHPREHTR
jgi:hypothetical protein